jgi:hypothetical protein
MSKFCIAYDPSPNFDAVLMFCSYHILMFTAHLSYYTAVLGAQTVSVPSHECLQTKHVSQYTVY